MGQGGAHIEWDVFRALVFVELVNIGMAAIVDTTLVPVIPAATMTQQEVDVYREQPSEVVVMVQSGIMPLEIVKEEEY